MVRFDKLSVAKGNYQFMFENVGDTLAKVSSIQFQIGAAEREMVQSAIVNTIAPLKRFLEGEMKNINVTIII